MATSPTTTAPVDEALTRNVRIYEYSTAADPIASGATPAIPHAEFPASLHQAGASRIIPLDLSAKLKKAGPLTSPGLAAHFIRIEAGETVETRPNASSELYYVLRGAGQTRFEGQSIPWTRGDILTLPAGSGATHEAEEDAAFYWVTDEPLLRYLGAKASEPTFAPTLYRAEDTLRELAAAANDPEAANRSRVSVLLANKECDQTLTVTPVLWAMLGILPIHAVQLPHRHQSVALDLIIDCQPGCYTLVGKELGPDGRILDPVRVDWKPASVFVTPAGRVARPLQRVGRRGLPPADPGRRAANVPPEPRHPVLPRGLNPALDRVQADGAPGSILGPGLLRFRFPEIPDEVGRWVWMNAS